MKTKISFLLLVLLLVCNTYADNVHDGIFKLLNTVLKKQFSSCIVKGIIAPDFDSFLQKKLPNDINKTTNLTGKLFFFLLSKYLGVNETKSIIMFTVYPLYKGHIQRIKTSNAELKLSKFHSFDNSNDNIIQNYLVKITIGRGYPNEKLIFLSMRKSNNTFLIEPAGCIFGNKSFFDAVGLNYDAKLKEFNWEPKKRESFINFLRPKNIKKAGGLKAGGLKGRG